MNELYNQTKKHGRMFFHKNYCLFHNHNVTAIDAGTVRLISIDPDGDLGTSIVTVFFADGSCSRWSTRWLSAYNFQFGVSVSFDGKYLFAQTWDHGLLCLDSHTGKKVWKTKSKRGITNLFVNDNTILCHQRERALQLINLHNGELLKEKRPATAWGFTQISNCYIVCQVTARRWEIINTETLETKLSFSHREFTAGHEDYCVNHIQLDGNTLNVRGFKNVWDNASVPPKLLPNLEFDHNINIELDA